MKCVLFVLALFSVGCRGQNINEKIVLINAGTAGREKITLLLDTICRYDPKVVAIDFQFSREGDQEIDEKLIDALAKCPNLVMVSVIEDYSPSRLFHERFILGNLEKFTKNAKTGFANLLPEEDISGTLKRFSQWEYVNGREELSFAMQIAHKFDSTQAAHYKMGHKKINEVDFSGGLRDFKKFSIDDFFSRSFDREDIEGNIVMVGFLGPGQIDKFVAPLTTGQNLKDEPNIYGLEFHAQIVAQILQD